MSDAIKVVAKLDKDDDGWPPFETEGFWCQRSDKGLIVDSIPYFISGLALDDLIEATPDESGILTFRGVLEPSRNSTIWLYFFWGDSTACLDGLAALGCGYDGQPIPGYFGVNVPATTAIGAVDAVLQPLVVNGALEAAYPTIRAPT